MNSNDRIKVYDRAPALPGTCVICGSAGGDNRRFLDFGMSIDWHGAVYFCTACIVPIASAIGYVPKTVYDRLETEYIEERSITGSLAKRVKVLTSAMVGLLQCSDIDLSSAEQYVSSLLAAMEKQSEADRAEQDTVEPVRVEGSKYLHDTSGSDGSLAI